MPNNNNFSLEENGLAPKNYFIADSFFQYIPCFLGMTLSIDSILNLNKESDDFEILNNFKNSLITAYPKYRQGINCCDYMYYYYCLKYMKPELMRNLINSPELLEDYFTINNHGNKEQLLYTYIKQVTIYDKPGTIYYIAIIDNIDNTPTIVRKEYTVGESGIIQFYNSKIFGIIPKNLLDFSIEDNNINYSIESTFLDIEDCPFQEKIEEYDDSLSRVDMTITTSEIFIDKIQNENWEIPYELNPDDEPDSEDTLTVYVKDAFIDQVCVFLAGQIGTKENTLLVFQDGSNVSYMSKNTCVWNYGQTMDNITSDKAISYQYGEVLPQYCEYYSLISAEYLDDTAHWSIYADEWPYYRYFSHCKFEITVSWEIETIYDNNNNAIGWQEIPYVSQLYAEATPNLLRAQAAVKTNDSAELFLGSNYGRLPQPNSDSKDIIGAVYPNTNFNDIANGQTMEIGSNKYFPGVFRMNCCNAFLTAKNRIEAAKNNNTFESSYGDAVSLQGHSITLSFSRHNQNTLPFPMKHKNGQILTSCRHLIHIDGQGKVIDEVQEGSYSDFTTRTYYYNQ